MIPRGERSGAADAVSRWNERFPVGTPVRYWRGARLGLGAEGVTRSMAELCGGHTAVVWIEGCRGCVALTHVEPDRASVER